MKEWRFVTQLELPLVLIYEFVGIDQSHFESMRLAIVEIQLH